MVAIPVCRHITNGAEQEFLFLTRAPEQATAVKFQGDFNTLQMK